MNVTVAGLKAHLNLDTDEDNTLLAVFIEGAKGWIAGYIDTPFPEENTPAALALAAQQLAAFYYEHRGEDYEADVPASVRSLCSPFIVWTV